MITFYTESDIESLKKHNQALIYNRDKICAEMAQQTELLKECRKALRELQCYDLDFYNRTCYGLIAAIDTHLIYEPHPTQLKASPG